MESVIRVQILDKTVCISLHVNTLGKGLNLSVLSPAVCKIVERLSSSALVRQPVLEKENLEFKPAGFHLKEIICQ